MENITLVATYPCLNGDYTISISGPKDKVHWVANKLNYCSLDELNDEDLKDITIEENWK